MNEAGDN
jgi:hypothetical protein